MKTKILLTLIIVGAYSWVISAITQATETIQKYASLHQFDNSEVSFKFQQNIGNMTYVNYLLIVFAIFQIARLWKPKTCSTI